jgi:periplasmic divalent cation tolerance protein
MPYSVVYITTADENEAKKIGRALVEENLVACVNIYPIQSIYRWQGKIEEGGEIAVEAKTRSELVDRVITRVRELHSYDVPCIIAWQIETGNPDYLQWIAESTEEV